MHLKAKNRQRRVLKARTRMRRQKATRLVVHRTPVHIYAQIISDDKVLASASTLDKTLRTGPTSNKEAAKKVGALIAERAISAGVKEVAFDRAGFSYHGRVKALADAARGGGLQF